jgi:hypothetical protein
MLSGLTGCIVPAKPVCRHSAVASAILYAEEGREVRIASYSTKMGTRHAEAQVKEPEGWRFISMSCDKNMVSKFPDFDMEQVRYYELHAYLLHIGIVPSWDSRKEEVALTKWRVNR